MDVATKIKKGFFKMEKYTLDLQLFAGEGAEAVGVETGENSADAGQNGTEKVNVDEEFSNLINGKFKEQFTKKTQAIIDKRFKQTKELEDYKKSVSPVVEKLLEKYGYAPGEEGRLFEALEKADEENIQSPESPREVFEDSRRDALKKRVGGWIKESEEIKSLYPDFDLRNELRTQKLFSQLLLGGAPLRAAYETVHKDEILSGAMAYTANTVREQVVKGIETKGRRPLENGISSETAVLTSVDVNSLTSKDILKILKQVENGAQVKFG